MIGKESVAVPNHERDHGQANKKPPNWKCEWKIWTEFMWLFEWIVKVHNSQLKWTKKKCRQNPDVIARIFFRGAWGLPWQLPSDFLSANWSAWYVCQTLFWSICNPIMFVICTLYIQISGSLALIWNNSWICLICFSRYPAEIMRTLPRK